MERLSDRAIEIINELHRERLDYESEYLPSLTVPTSAKHMKTRVWSRKKSSGCLMRRQS